MVKRIFTTPALDSRIHLNAMLSQGEHAGFEANVFLQKTLTSNAPTAPEYVEILADISVCH